jgi:antitoxin VapB
VPLRQRLLPAVHQLLAQQSAHGLGKLAVHGSKLALDLAVDDDKGEQVWLGRMCVIFYPAAAMGMNIKDPEVHAMARELAARRSTTVTDAVRQALRAELERSGHESEEQTIRLRKQRVQELLDRFRRLSWPEGVSSKELQDALYDEHGLPI